MGTPSRYYSSTARKTTLTAGISAVATSMSVAGVTGWPSLYPYTLIIDRDTVNEEVVTVTARSGLNVTVTRGSDSTPAVTHTAGATVEHGVSARDFAESRTHESDSEGVHGLALGSAVLGRTDTQTFTNKTMGSNLAAGGFKITGLADPTSAQDAVTKNYADTGMASQLAQATAAKVAAEAAEVNAELAETNAETAQAAAAASQTAAAGSATAAGTSATNAAASASTATTKASEASTSATNAATSASAASTSATAAATSATNAATSATAAGTSASAASSSASSASSSATSATASAATATTKASEASTSATNAATSASAASGSATTASTAATNAASSASSASTSATTATGAASTATTQATNAAASATAAAGSATAAAGSATSAASSATSAEAAFDSFDDRYLGAKTSDPTVDNDGNPLITGALYFNSVSNAMKVYNGSTWDLVAPDTSSFISKTIVDAKGDLIAGTAADTVARVAVGTDGWVLTADSTQTPGMKWAAVSGLPSQTGNTGKYLTTDGSAASWAPVGARGGGTDQVFYENDTTVTTNYTITTSKNAVTAGPVTINSGVTVTVPSGSSWVVV